MIAESKLTFAAWTGLGITAIFGGTGIYLVRNSQNLGKRENEKEKEEISLEQDPSGEDSLPKQDPELETLQKEQVKEVHDPDPFQELDSPELGPMQEEQGPADADSSNELEEPLPPKTSSSEEDSSKQKQDEREEEIPSFSLDDGENATLQEISEK